MVLVVAWQRHGGTSKIVFAPELPSGSTLVTNEFATYNPGSAEAHRSTSWISTSGSLFSRDGAGYSGLPDTGTPDATSSNATGSSVFRLVSRRADFGNVSIRMRFRIDGLQNQPGTTNAWDGLHIFARYQTQVHLYVVSISRRDGSVVAKKKMPGGGSNGGTYYQIGPAVYEPLAPKAWHDVQLDVRNANGGVRLELHLDGHLALNALDDGEGGAPITQVGRVGLRGDNCEFDFQDFEVETI